MGSTQSHEYTEQPKNQIQVKGYVRISDLPFKGSIPATIDHMHLFLEEHSGTLQSYIETGRLLHEEQALSMCQSVIYTLAELQQHHSLPYPRIEPKRIFVTSLDRQNPFKLLPNHLFSSSAEDEVASLLHSFDRKKAYINFAPEALNRESKELNQFKMSVFEFGMVILHACLGFQPSQYYSDDFTSITVESLNQKLQHLQKSHGKIISQIVAKCLNLSQIHRMDPTQLAVWMNRSIRSLKNSTSLPIRSCQGVFNKEDVFLPALLGGYEQTRRETHTHPATQPKEDFKNNKFALMIDTSLKQAHKKNSFHDSIVKDRNPKPQERQNGFQHISVGSISPHYPPVGKAFTQPVSSMQKKEAQNGKQNFSEANIYYKQCITNRSQKFRQKIPNTPVKSLHQTSASTNLLTHNDASTEPAREYQPDQLTKSQFGIQSRTISRASSKSSAAFLDGLRPYEVGRQGNTDRIKEDSQGLISHSFERPYHRHQTGSEKENVLPNGVNTSESIAKIKKEIMKSRELIAHFNGHAAVEQERQSDSNCQN